MPQSPHYMHSHMWHKSTSVHVSRHENSFPQNLPRFLFAFEPTSSKTPNIPTVFTHREQGVFFEVESRSTFIQKGICVYEVENKWMRTPCYVGNAIWCLCSVGVRATYTISDCSVSEQKQFIFMEIFWLSWKLVLGNHLCRREVKDRH